MWKLYIHIYMFLIYFFSRDSAGGTLPPPQVIYVCSSINEPCYIRELIYLLSDLRSQNFAIANLSWTLRGLIELNPQINLNTRGH